MNPVEEFLAVSPKTAGFPGALWKGLKFQNLEPVMDVATGLAKKPTGLENFGTNLGSQMSVAAVLGGLTLGGEAAIRGARTMINMGIDKWKKPMEYKAMLDAHPELKHEDAAKVQALYNSLRHMSPHMSKDPVIAGSFIRNLLNQGNEGSVAIPMDTAKMLADTQKSVATSRKMEPSQFTNVMSKTKNPVGGSSKQDWTPSEE
jgi:hypothetical protein